MINGIIIKIVFFFENAETGHELSKFTSIIFAERCCKIAVKGADNVAQISTVNF